MPPFKDEPLYIQQARKAALRTKPEDRIGGYKTTLGPGQARNGKPDPRQQFQHQGE